MQKIIDIRRKLFAKKKNNDYVEDKSGCKMIELVGETFVCDDDHIFGDPNQEYINKEFRWYFSQSRNVHDMPDPPKIWREVADKDGVINSNYGWCIYSTENFEQYKAVRKTLREKPLSRQAVMIYNRPSMHIDAHTNGRSDFMCTNAVQYLIRKDPIIEEDVLTAVVQMRSNDVVFGFRNDYAWQHYVVESLAKDLNIDQTKIIWHVGSLHVYERHFNLIK